MGSTTGQSQLLWVCSFHDLHVVLDLQDVAVCISMAQLLEGARNLGWVLLNSFLRFIFVFINNCVAIPSYCLYCILLQPLRVMDSRTFWLIEGIMFKWMLAMVSQWGWVAGYTDVTKCYIETQPKTPNIVSKSGYQWDDYTCIPLTHTLGVIICILPMSTLNTKFKSTLNKNITATCNNILLRFYSVIVHIRM
ncbi:unnamed protein product [Oncorhynchus mykiss]|uniref:Uncharacterized protein n=1 Tax=Oncorhynchus mykiss TaxID=8022 RepID=A0A060XEP9_ONCMY|nr:unnamed protein product [Oncorhynchus mykiss]